MTRRVCWFLQCFVRKLVKFKTHNLRSSDDDSIPLSLTTVVYPITIGTQNVATLECNPHRGTDVTYSPCHEMKMNSQLGEIRLIKARKRKGESIYQTFL